MITRARTLFQILLVVLLGISVSGCEAIVDIFQAGIWVGALMVVVLIGVVAFLAAKIRRS